MTHKECMESDSAEAVRVREILSGLDRQYPDDLTMYRIVQALEAEEAKSP